MNNEEFLTDEQQEQQEYMKMLKACYEDRTIEINGRTYTISKTTHQKRKTVFAFFSTLKNKDDAAWIDSKEFSAIQNIIDNILMYDGELLSKRKDHWENPEMEEDFLQLYSTAMGVLSYPFLPGKPLD